MYQGHDKAGEMLTRLFLASFPFHAALMSAGEKLTAPVGLTASRWQVLSAIARSETRLTVSAVARQMGLTRQAVQRLASELASSGFLQFSENPDHKRASLLCLTQKGDEAFRTMVNLQVPWANSLAAGIAPERLADAVDLLKSLTDALGEVAVE